MDTRVLYWKAVKALSALTVASGEPEPELTHELLYGLLYDQIIILRKLGWTDLAIVENIRVSGLNLTLANLQAMEQRTTAEKQDEKTSANQTKNVVKKLAQNVSVDSNRLSHLADTLPKLLTGTQADSEQAVSENERIQFSLVADSLPDMIWMVNENVQVTYLNSRWNEYTALCVYDE